MTMSTDVNGTEVDFSAIIASSVHDMKNSLGLLLTTLDEIVGECPPETCPTYKRFSQVLYEARRVNNDLIQLLALYRMGNSIYTLNVAHHSVHDFLEERVLESKPLLDFNRIEIELECPDDLYWFFDGNLVSGVINNVLNNAFRYTKDKLKVSAAEENGHLAIRIEDNGRGYPAASLTGENEVKNGISFKTGSTGLGLYFSSLAARMHKNGGNQGYISMYNGGTYGGGCFAVNLP